MDIDFARAETDWKKSVNPYNVRLNFRRKQYKFFLQYKWLKERGEYVEKRYNVVVMVEAERVTGGIYECSGSWLAKWEILSWKGRGCREVLECIWQSIQDAAEQNGIPIKEIVRVGISIPGEVTKNGVVLYCQELGWGKADIERIWVQISPLPVMAASRKNMILLGEYYKQEPAVSSHLGGLYLGGKQESALIINKSFIWNRDGISSDLGNMPIYYIEPNGKIICQGINEDISYSGIIKKYEHLKKESMGILQYSGKKSDMEEIAQAQKRGEPAADKVFDEAAEMIVCSIVCITAIGCLERFIIYGTGSEADDILMRKIEICYNRLQLSRKIQLDFVRLNREVILESCARALSGTYKDCKGDM